MFAAMPGAVGVRQSIHEATEPGAGLRKGEQMHSVEVQAVNPKNGPHSLVQFETWRAARLPTLTSLLLGSNSYSSAPPTARRIEKRVKYTSFNLEEHRENVP